MAMGSICEDCINRYHCIFDSSANVLKCGMYNQKPDLSELFDQIADKIADKVAEKLKNDK